MSVTSVTSGTGEQPTAGTPATQGNRVGGGCSTPSS